MTIQSMQRPEFDIARVFSATVGAIGRNFAPFAVLALIFSVIPQVAIAWITGPDSPIYDPANVATAFLPVLGVLISMISSFILQAAIIHGAVDDLNGRKADLGACLATAMRNLLPVILMSILMALGMMIGFILLIVPGIVLAILWCAAVPAQVVENRGVMGSLSRSTDLTEGSRWRILGLMVLYVILSWIATAVFLGLGTAVSGGITGMATSGLVQYVMSPLIGGLSAMVGAAGSAAIYSELRLIKEGAEPSSLAAVFD